MNEEVWIHWSQGAWLVTSDGLELIDKARRVVLRDVRFVIDPVGLEISRTTGKAKTHAWAVGEVVDWTPNLTLTQLAWHPLTYRPRRGDDHFGILNLESGELATLEGVKFLEAELDADDGWSPIARISEPRFGDTERRRVQQYGGRR